MTAEQMRLIPELFDLALGQPPDGRDAFLRQACAGDEQLFQAVISLLDNHHEDDSFLAVSALGEAAQIYAANAQATLGAGTRLGNFTVVGPLGRGGMGEVYLARDLKLGREVAIKILPDHFAADAERAARFAREARLLAQLKHPLVADIYALEEADGRRFLVLEYVPGETLAARLAKGRLPVREALAVCAQIADALAATHEAGVLHRDLKPANVCLTPKGLVKLLDFGIAKHFRAARLVPPDSPLLLSSNDAPPPPLTEMLTTPGVTPGTVAYLSPEQCANQSAATESDGRAVDLWAFGLVLYESLCGVHPFKEQTSVATKAAIREREPDWAALPADVPTRVVKLLRACLEKDPCRRLHDAAEAKRLLAEAVGDNSSLVATLGSAYKHSSPTLKATFCAALLLAVFAAAWSVVKLARSPIIAREGGAPTRLAVIAWTDANEAEACSPGRSRATARLIADKLRSLPALKIVAQAETSLASARSLPLLATDLSGPQAARTEGADVVLRVAAECSGLRQGVKYSLVARDGRTLASSDEADFRQLLADVLGALDVRTDRAGWSASDNEQRYYQALVALDQYASEQSINDAVRTLEELKDADPANRTRTLAALGLGWYLKHNLTRRAEDKEKAVAYCDQISGSRASDALVRCGVVLAATGHAERAVKSFEQALAERADDAEATLGLAQAYEQQGDEVEWVCTEDDWEVAFVEDRTAGAASPFISDTFGPGLTEATGKTPRQSQTRLRTDELPKYLTGVTTEDAEDGRDFKYEARVRSFSPRTARVRIFRRVRPH